NLPGRRTAELRGAQSRVQLAERPATSRAKVGGGGAENCSYWLDCVVGWCSICARGGATSAKTACLAVEKVRRATRARIHPPGKNSDQEGSARQPFAKVS